MSSELQIRVDGRMLSSFAAWGEAQWVRRFDGGCLTAQWRMEVRPGWSHPVIRRGALVEILQWSRRVWRGVLAEPNRESWEMHATGPFAKAQKALALTAGGEATATPTVAIDQAIARGAVQWTGHTGFPSTAFATGADLELNYLSALLTAACEAEGLHWGVDADGVAYARPEPTEPMWRMTPGAAVLGVADDDYITHLYGRHRLNATTLATTLVGDDGSPGTPSWNWGRVEHPVDLTPRDTMSGAAATAALTGMLVKVGPRPGWSTALEPGTWELTTMGGTPAHDLTQVLEGQRVRLHGVLSEDLVPLPHLDFTIGEVRQTQDGESVYIEPLGMAARDLPSILESR